MYDGSVNPACYSKNAKVYLTNIFDKFPANADGQNVSTFSSLNNVRQDIVRIDHKLQRQSALLRSRHAG